MREENKWCKLFGHKWKPVYIGKYNKWRIIACYCERCHYGNDGLLNYLDFLKYKKGYDYGTYSEEYYKQGMDVNQKSVVSKATI